MTIDDGAIERLVVAAQQGDPEAFGALFDHYYGPVYRYVAARVGRPSDAEDLAQLVFVKALEALPRYESRGIPFGGWLFRLARNVVIDAYDTAIDRLTTSGGVSAARAREAVQLHRSILLQVAANAPAGAAGGLERALANSNRVIEALGGDPGNGSPGGNGNPGGKPEPATSAEPNVTREPTAKPGRTPPPHKTPDPGKPGGSTERGQQPAPSDARPWRIAGPGAVPSG